MKKSNISKDDNRTDMNVKKKKYVNFKELREKLISKLPEHKETILKMNDAELEKIYWESMGSTEQKSKSDQNKKATKHSKDNQRPVIVVSSKNVTDAHDLTGESDIYTHVDTPKTQVVEINSNETKKKRVKTFVLMHVEEEDDDDRPCTISRKENGVERICKECQNTDIGTILKKLAILLSKK